MPYPDPIFPGALWDGLSRNPDRTSKEQRVDPDLNDWDRSAAEMLSVQAFLLGGGAIFTVTEYTGAATLPFVPQVALVDATSGSIVITLPVPTGNLYTINVKKIDITANLVTVDGNGANIDGQATQVINTQYTSIALATDGTEWFVI